MKRLQERYDLVALPILDRIPPRAIYLLWSRDAALPPEVEDFRQRIVGREDLAQSL
jgi:DNA-binding transcriptional LysR family regulator